MADSTHIRTEVLTPEGKLFEGDLYQLSARTVVGEVGVRAQHAPMLARLVPNVVRLYETREEFNASGGKRYAAAEGWLEVFADKVVLLVEEAHEPDGLDAVELRERIADAEQRVAEAEEGTATHEVATADLQRAQAFLEVAEG